MDVRSPETRAARSRRALQIAVALCSLVPITAGGAGMLLGPALVASIGTHDLDSHFRYLSGLLLAFVARVDFDIREWIPICAWRFSGRLYPNLP
jgi:hypothetical protein